MNNYKEAQVENKFCIMFLDKAKRHYLRTQDRDTATMTYGWLSMSRSLKELELWEGKVKLLPAPPTK